MILQLKTMYNNLTSSNSFVIQVLKYMCLTVDIFLTMQFIFRAKIRNIEATEEAKLKLLWERHRKKDGPSQFVPTNMAVNFVQHNRCKNF